MRTYHMASSVSGSPHVFIATPSTGLQAVYTFSIAKALPRLMAEGIAADFCMLVGHCHVDDARNALVREFLQTDCTDLIFIDADVGFDPEDLIKLCRHDRDMVAGVYPLKQTEEDYPVRVKAGAELWADADGLVEVEGVPTGFLKIKRSVIERMIAADPNRKFLGRGQEDGPPHHILFERMIDEFTRYSGDYAFCRKWQKLGGKMYVDPEMALAHEGNFVWSGVLGDFWKRKHGIAAQEAQTAMDSAVARIRDGHIDEHALLDLVQGWDNRAAASPELLMAAWELARTAHGAALECGSGLTTIIMALANPDLRIHALESNAVWADKTQQALDRYGVTNAKIHLCPLGDHDGRRWYSTPSSLPDDFSLVVNDGPWRAHGDRSVLFDVMVDRLHNAVVLMDDINDPTQGAALDEWCRRTGRQAHRLGGTKRFAISPPLAMAQAAEQPLTQARARA